MSVHALTTAKLIRFAQRWTGVRPEVAQQAAEMIIGGDLRGIDLEAVKEMHGLISGVVPTFDEEFREAIVDAELEIGLR